MANRTTFVSNVTDGDTLSQGFYTELYKYVPKVKEVYTSTGFDSTGAKASYDLAVSANTVQNYVVVVATVQAVAQGHKTGGDVTVSATPQLSIGTSTSPNAVYGSATLLRSNEWGTATGADVDSTQTVVGFYAPTSGEKSSGFSMRVTGGVLVNGGAGSVTNKQTVLLIM